MNSDQQRIRGLKTVLLSIVLSSVGLAALVASRVALEVGSLSWLRFWPLSEIGSTLFVTGLLAVFWDYFDSRDREARDDGRVRRLLKESAPEFTDAVVRGFAVGPEDLRRVASPDLLDAIATNVMSLRLGDDEFASEIYRDIRDQAIRAAERWRDVEVRLRLAAVDRDSAAPPAFEVLVEWEYTTVPNHDVRRFACVADRDEYDELTTDVTATSTWFMRRRTGFDASSRDSYELVYFSVDGEGRPIRRSVRKTGQTYSVTIGEDAVTAGKPVKLRHVYRVLTPQSGHFLYVEVPQPTRGFSFDVDYRDTEIADLRVTDLLSGSDRTRIARLPNESSRTVSVDHPGWVLPRAGVAIAWTLLSETDAANRPADATSATASRS